MMPLARMPLASIVGCLDIWLFGPFDACLNALFDDADGSDVSSLGCLAAQILGPLDACLDVDARLDDAVPSCSMMLFARLLASMLGRFNN
jgi:hypothetical protein